LELFGFQTDNILCGGRNSVTPLAGCSRPARIFFNKALETTNVVTLILNAPECSKQGRIRLQSPEKRSARVVTMHDMFTGAVGQPANEHWRCAVVGAEGVGGAGVRGAAAAAEDDGVEEWRRRASRARPGSALSGSRFGCSCWHTADRKTVGACACESDATGWTLPFRTPCTSTSPDLEPTAAAPG